METIKKVMAKLFVPHTAIVILIIPIAAVMLIYAFLHPYANAALIYFSYALSAYALTILCVRAPRVYQTLSTLWEENQYIRRYAEDACLRVKISLYSSIFINIAYAALQMGLGFYHKSVWFYSLAAYYTLLAIMRFFLLRDVRVFVPGAHRIRELYRYRFCGTVLLFMNLVLAIIVFYITWQGRGFKHHYITTIAMAAYTFGMLTVAIVNAIKYKKYKSPLLSASKAINLVSASVAILTLETAMLTAFGDETTQVYRRIMTGITGGAVCAFALGMAIYMITNSNREIKRSHKNGEQKRTEE